MRLNDRKATHEGNGWHAGINKRHMQLSPTISKAPSVPMRCGFHDDACSKMECPAPDYLPFNDPPFPLAQSRDCHSYQSLQTLTNASACPAQPAVCKASLLSHAGSAHGL